MMLCSALRFWFKKLSLVVALLSYSSKWVLFVFLILFNFYKDHCMHGPFEIIVNFGPLLFTLVELASPCDEPCY